MKNTFLFFCLYWLLGISACKDSTPDDNNNDVQDQVKASLNNGGFNNQFVVFSDIDPDAMEAGYIDSLQITRLSVIGFWNAQNALFQFEMEGNSPNATVNYAETLPPNAQCPTANPCFVLQLGMNQLIITQDITVHITEYGAVGERIKGTFEGQMIDIQSGETVDISNGQFNLKRTQ